MKKKFILLGAMVVLVAVCVIWIIWGNVTVGLNHITVTQSSLPAAFDGFRIAHVSDLHNSKLWKKTIEQLKTAGPDIICITGDVVDSNRTDVQLALDFAAEAVKIAPCYYVPGNHEGRLSKDVYSQLVDGLTAFGVTVLEDSEVRLTRDSESISLVGRGWSDLSHLEDLSNFEGYRLLLSHHPEFFADYVAGEYDLVLSGHAHGGQFRLPFVGGLFAPGQGFLPEYDSGLYTSGRTNMIVSRGIGNSSFPIRFGNRPEVVLITLTCGDN